MSPKDTSDAFQMPFVNVKKLLITYDYLHSCTLWQQEVGIFTN